MDYELLLLNLSRNADSAAPHFMECIGQHLIAAYLAEHGFRAKVYSGDILRGEAVISHEVQAHGVRYVGFYVGADNVVMVGNLIRKLKASFDVIVLVGGPEAAALEQTFLRKTGCDFIVAGEGERPILALLSCLEDGVGQLDAVANLRYLKPDGSLHSSPLEEPIRDLDALPYPRREDSLRKNFRMGRAIGLLTGRGCPFHCSFCYEGAASKAVRLRSIPDVMGEIDEVRSYNPNLRQVNIYDDTFTLFPERVREFGREMKRRGLKWTCEAHVSRVFRHPEMIEEMLDSGLIAMQIGIESGSQRVLDAYQKQITPEMIYQVVRHCHKAGLPLLEGNYIIGGALESDDTLQESLSHAKRLLHAGRGMLELNTVYFAPYFDTPITKCPGKFGMRIRKDRLEHMVISMTEPVCETESLSLNEIIAWKQKFDEELNRAYSLEASQCQKSDLLRGILSDSRMEIRNFKWYAAWSRIPHMQDFLLHSTAAEQTVSTDKYPIRLGNLHEENEDFIIVDHTSLTGLASKAWRWADGRCTISQISTEHGIATDELMSAYRSLNQNCFLYYSPF